MSSLDAFLPAAKAWFLSNFAQPTPVQEEGWRAISAKHHALLLAPTGSGKTLAAFFWAIDSLLRLPIDAPKGVRVIYVSPLKALVYDIERNLQAPLVGARRYAEKDDLRLRDVNVAIRTGDTSQKERARQLKEPADILVTTPESLFLLLLSQAKKSLTSVHTVIVDEIHAVAPSKRGAHLALSLERLELLTPTAPQRIGLSATVNPKEDVARFLGGDRAVTIVDYSCRAHIDLKISVAQRDMQKADADAALQPPKVPSPGGSILGKIAQQAQPQDIVANTTGRAMGGIWQSIVPAIAKLLDDHQSTIVFVNSRALCERLAQSINGHRKNDDVWTHHGSLSPKRRNEVEEALKEGRLRGIVATSSLELGIDMGQIDLVVLVESPQSVSRGLQRIGRAGHGVGQKSKGIIFPKYTGDLLECAVVAEHMRQANIEAIKIPFNALDVMCQHIVAMCIEAPQSLDVIHAVMTRSYPYHALSRQALTRVLDLLSGTYPSDEFAQLKPYLSWDRTTDLLSARKGARLTVVLNAGTIVDRGSFGVFLAGEGPRVGELDEEMVHESRKGDTFMLGSSTWRIEQITRDKVIVTPAPGEPGRMPFWRGQSPGRPIEMGRAIGAFTHAFSALDAKDAYNEATQKLGLDPNAAHNLVTYVAEQRAATGVVPSDTTIVIERFVDEIGDWRICILSPFGAKVHQPWALCIEAILSERAGFEVQALASDDGIALRLQETKEVPDLSTLLPDADTIEDLLMAQLQNSALFAGAFRENAARALLLPKRQGQKRTPMWQQRLRAKTLLAAASRYPSFPIILETYRECLRDLFDVPSLIGLLQDIQARRVQLVEVTTQSPSPFARALAFHYVSTYLYASDAPLAERRAQALSLDRTLLSELLGHAEIRNLIDIQAIAQIEDMLMATHVERRAKDEDALSDILLSQGDLSLDEITKRCQGSDHETDVHRDVVGARQNAEAWIARLIKQRRAIKVRVASQVRFVAAADAGRYRDALGVVPPSGLPKQFLQSVEAPLKSLVRRYARTRGPFVVDDVATRFGVAQAQVASLLVSLGQEQVVVNGAFLPGGTTLEWCEAQVLRQIRKRSLMRSRDAVAAVEPNAWARFLCAWQHVDMPKKGALALEEVMAQMAGLALPFSAWVDDVLPLRVVDFRCEMLDVLCAMGSLVWVGHGSLGPRDGRVAFYSRNNVHLLGQPALTYAPPTPAHLHILDFLKQRGACFMVELKGVVPNLSLDALQAILWDLVWAGQITNDTTMPLLSLVKKRRGPSGNNRSLNSGGLSFGGRWSRVDSLYHTTVTDTDKGLARAHAVLHRYGIVTREVAHAENMVGGFVPLYEVLKAMEETGQVRRGYFIDTLGGAQFAYAAAVEQLRQHSDTAHASKPTRPVKAVRLSAVDPAQVWGSLLPWPARLDLNASGKPRRIAKAQVIVYDGNCLAFVEPDGHALLLFYELGQNDDTIKALVDAMRPMARRLRGNQLTLRRIDGQAALAHPMAQKFVQSGMLPSFDGLTISAYDDGLGPWGPSSRPQG